MGWVHSGGIAETRPDGIAERQPLLRQLSEPELLRLAGSGQRYLLSREEDHVPRYLESGKPGSSCWRWPAPPTIWQDLRDLLGAREILTAYGMTETTASTTCTLPEGPNSQLLTTNGCMKFAGVAGDPALRGILAQYKTIDPITGLDLPPGESGELVARGPIVTRGYYKKDEESRAAFTPGWMVAHRRRRRDYP